jgi:hypothetical protein
MGRAVTLQICAQGKSLLANEALVGPDMRVSVAARKARYQIRNWRQEVQRRSGENLLAQ